MAQNSPIRRRTARVRRDGFGWLEVAFWLVLALAVAIGGASAGEGLPALIGVFLPSGWMAAQADVQGPARRIELSLRLPAAATSHPPEVLPPAGARGMPERLAERARHATSASGRSGTAPAPAIAIVIDDLGPDVAATRRAIALPKAVTMSFLPYGDDTPALARVAERAGHQVIVHVPMQPDGDEDPGPMALRVDLPPARNIARLDWALSRVPGYAGINNHMGSRFTSDRKAMIPVMAHLVGRTGFFLDSRTAPHTVIVPLAREFGILSAGRDVFLDDVQRRAYVDRQLAETERIARENGVAIAIGHPHDITLAALEVWTARVAADGYRLIPLGTAIRLKTEDAAMTVADAKR